MSAPWEKYAEQEGPWTRYQQPAAAPENTEKQDSSILAGLGKGAAMGLADIGNTVINAAMKLPGVPESAQQWNRTRNADMEYIADSNKGVPFTVGRIGANVAATLPVGGVIGNAVKSVAPALGNAIATGGFKAGQVAENAPLLAKAIDMFTRMTGGAITGGAATALVSPEDTGKGAMIGAATPPALSIAGKAAGHLGRSVGSVVKPFMPSGQEEIAANILRKFAAGGPTAVNTAELVPGSIPTLAEATGNAGIATLQRAARDIRPNAFAERELSNSAARQALFDEIAGSAAKMQAADAAREEAAAALYGKAFAADAMRRDLAKGAQATRAPFAGAGLSGKPDDLATPGLRELAQRPEFGRAIEDAKRLAANKGHHIGDPLQSLEGLHYIKLALDDMMNPAAKSAMGRNASGAVGDMRAKLTEELARVSPLYGNARQTYADMSAPINAMEALQGLKLTDAKGEITLSRVKNALDGLRRQQEVPGVNAAKSVTAEQIQALDAIYNDLLRASNTSLGKSIGSNTFQNIATDNIINNVGGKWLGTLANKSGAGGLLGQAGRLAYSGPNEAIRGKLVDMMLNPEAAQAALQQEVGSSALTQLLERLSSSSSVQALPRATPLLTSDR